VSSGEEILAARPEHECCTFRGSISALFDRTDNLEDVIPQPPKPTGKNAKGTQQFGPAGGGI
jgi:polyvinyl alcohol dehydrogenase (cytochrome)